MFKQISSIQNPLIKELFQLREKSRIRKKTQSFLIEGLREISLAQKGNYKLKSLLFYPEIISEEKLKSNLDIDGLDCIEISKEIYEKLAYRTTTEGVLAVANTKDLSISNCNFDKKNPLILIAEAPEKPGNIGAILRTADAANVDAVMIANPKTDMYNPNIIRSSVGCVFTNEIFTGSTDEICTFLEENNINSYAAALADDSEIYTAQDFTQATAIVVGTEATGLSETWMQKSTKKIIIPMQGAIDSMNVSVAAGILIFEAKRQRDFT